MSSGSFTFCGVDIQDLGLEYAPELSDTYVYQPAETESHVESFDAHNGGYYYGSWLKPKVFNLRCIFEEKQIDKGIMAKVYALFKVGRTGQLIFSRRPWCYYYATVAEPIQPEYTNYLNGIVTITLQSMYPFARSNIMTILRGDRQYESMRQNTAVYDKEGMELPDEYDLIEETEIIIANPGTERAGLGFYISGDVGEGVIIYNKTTNQKCKMIKITKGNTTNDNKAVFVDSINRKTLLTGNDSKEYAFKYHEYGFIELEPAFPAARDLHISSEAGAKVTVSNILREDLTGKYLFVKDAWYKIIEQTDKHTLVLNSRTGSFIDETTMAMDMNEITITPVTTMDIHIQFVFKPTYA